MKIGHYNSECVALRLLALLRTITLVLTQESPQCRQLMETCSNEAGSTTPLVTLATGLESRMATCNPPFDVIMDGDILEWLFTRTTIANANPVDINNNEKYSIAGARSQMLTVNNINSSDEGYYYCQIVRNRMPLSTRVPGACLNVYNPAVFQTCSGEDNTDMAQQGCPEIESLPSQQEGQTVEFNIALTHDVGPSKNCFNQSIQMVTFRKADSLDSLVECTNTSCQVDQRVNITRMNTFDIIITMSNLTLADSGNYVTIADIRRPTNSMRVCIYKNFSLTVLENPDPTMTAMITPTTEADNTQPTPSGQNALSQSSLVAIIVVNVVLVILLIALGVFVTILLLWTYKNRTKGEVYETIDKIGKVFRREKKMKKNGISLTSQENSTYRHSITEDGNVNLTDVWNSESRGV